MTLTLHLRPDVTVFAVLLPREATKPTIKRFEGKRWHVNWLFNDDPNVLGGLCIFYNHLGGKRKYPNHLEPIGLLREIPEEQAAGLMEYVDDVAGYLDYSESYNLAFDSAIDSFKTLIGAQGGDPEANWLIIKKIQ